MGIGRKIWLWGALCIFLMGCQSGNALDLEQGQPLADNLAVATLAPTVTERAALATVETPTIPPTATVKPTVTQTASPTAVSTQTPSPTKTAVPSPTATLTPEPTAVSRTCPDDAPLKPDYARYFLSPNVWPTPNLEQREAHFWLGKPLPGGGRLLFNKTYPYGFDGDGRYLLHNGVDSAEKLGTPVLAVSDGTVIVAQSDENALFGWRCDWYGQLVVVELDETWQGQPMYALYGHVLNINVDVGDRVFRGEQLAEVGFGGAARSAHLHFEIRIGSNEFDTTRNPMLWIEPPESRGVVVGRLIDPLGRPWQGVVVTLVGPDGTAEFINSYTYLDDPRHLINPDEWYAENFVFADVLPGEYIVVVSLGEKEYRATVVVTGSELSFVEIVTDAIGEE